MFLVGEGATLMAKVYMVTLDNFHIGFASAHVNFILFVHFVSPLLCNANVVSGAIWALRNGRNILVCFSSHRSHLDHM